MLDKEILMIQKATILDIMLMLKKESYTVDELHDILHAYIKDSEQ